MTPTPGDLAAAAATLRTSAAFVVEAVAPLAPRSSEETWEGPAAEAFRRQLVAVERRSGAVADGLRARAARLDRRADHLRGVLAAAEEVRWARDQSLNPSTSPFLGVREGSR